MHLLLSLLLSVSLHASSKTTDALRPLKSTLSKIQKTKLADFELEKKVTSDLMASEKTYEAHAYLSGSLFRLETEAPDRSLVVYDGKTLWIVQYPDKDFGGPIQVLKGRLTGKEKDQAILSQLLTNGRLLESFDLKKSGEENGIVTYDGSPKSKDLNLKKVSLRVDAKKSELKSLEYVDDVGNKTSMTVKAQKLLSKRRPELFKYKPEKGAQVSDL